MVFNYQNAADPALAEVPSDKRRNLLMARKFAEQEAATIQQILEHDTSHQDWKAELASVQAQIASIQDALHEPGNSETLSKKPLAIMRTFAIKDHASVRLIGLYIAALLADPPALLEDRQLAVSLSEREVVLTHHKDIPSLLWLAQVYRAAGQTNKSRATAKEGLALLPPLQPRGRKTNMQKLLEIQLQPSR